MSFSSLRKATPRPEHKERRQPKNRARLGLLEKHKDYVQRATDYHVKEKHVKSLQEKARLRNPDEFYFAMQSSKTKNDIHQVERKSFTPEMIRLMKTQDCAYIQQQSNILKHKLTKLEQEHPELTTGSNQDKKKAQHILFTDETPVIETENAKKEDKPAIKIRSSKLNQKREKLHKARQEQLEKLKKIERELRLKNLLTWSKGQKKAVAKTDDGATIYRWRAERQK